MVPLPQTSGATQNYTYSPTAVQRTDQFDVRGDQNLGKADRLFFKYSYISTDSLSPGTVPSVPVSEIPVGPYIAGGATNTSGFAAAITDRSATHDGCTTRAHGVAATITDRAAAHDGGAMTCFHNAGDETSNKAEDYDRCANACAGGAEAKFAPC